MEISTYRYKDAFIDENSNLYKIKEVLKVEEKQEIIGKPGEYDIYTVDKIIFDEKSRTTLSELYKNGFRLISVNSGIFFLERG